MAEAEPGTTEEVAEVGEEPVEVAETRISLTNVGGSVFRAHRLTYLFNLSVLRLKILLPSQVWNLRSIWARRPHWDRGSLPWQELHQQHTAPWRLRQDRSGVDMTCFPKKTFNFVKKKKFLQELSLLFPPGMSVCMDLVSQVVIMLVGLSWPSSSSPRCHAWCPSQEGAWAWGLNLSLGWRKSLSRRPPPLPRRKERRRNVDGWVWPYCVEQSRNIVRIGLLLFSDVFRQKSKLTCFSWTWNCNICRIPIHLLVVLSLFLLFSYHLFWCIGAYS